MDPNTKLVEIRNLVQEILDNEHVEENAEQLAVRVEELDQWIVNGGFLPDDWNDGEF